MQQQAAIEMDENRRGYGFWASTWWALSAIIAGIVLPLVVLAVFDSRFRRLSDARVEAYLALLICGTIVAVLFWAAKRTGWPPRDYFAFVPSPAIFFVIALAAEALWPVLEWALRWLVDDTASFEAERSNYRAAQDAGVIVLYWINSVLIFPVIEEILFRGFLLPNWARSRLGPAGAIVATSVLFGALHVQYEWTGMLTVGLAGALLGWLRLRSGSILPSIAGHCFGNAYAMLTIHFNL